MRIETSVNKEDTLCFTELDISTKGIVLETKDFELTLHCGVDDAEKLASSLLNSIKLYKERYKK